MIWPGYLTDTLVWLSRLPRKLKSTHAIFQNSLGSEQAVFQCFNVKYCLRPFISGSKDHMFTVDVFRQIRDRILSIMTVFLKDRLFYGRFLQQSPCWKIFISWQTFFHCIIQSECRFMYRNNFSFYHRNILEHVLYFTSYEIELKWCKLNSSDVKELENVISAHFIILHPLRLVKLGRPTNSPS